MCVCASGVLHVPLRVFVFKPCSWIHLSECDSTAHASSWPLAPILLDAAANLELSRPSSIHFPQSYFYKVVDSHVNLMSHYDKFTLWVLTASVSGEKEVSRQVALNYYYYYYYFVKKRSHNYPFAEE